MSGKSLFLKYFILGLGLLEAVLAGYVFYFNYMCMDHAEHLHAAWLIWQGKVPYRDFFEHHNPLLWYVLAPIVAAFYRNALIIYISRAISVLAYAVFFAGFYKICRRFLDISVQKFVLAVLFYFLVPDNMFMLFELQPDSFMWAAGIWGFYFLFSYIGEKRQRDLTAAFFLFFVSFMFLQKIMAILAIAGVYFLYLIYKKEISGFKDVFKALVPTLAGVGGWVLYLHYTNSFNLYLLLNYDLNFWLQEFYSIGRSSQDFRVTALLLVPGILCLKPFLAAKNRYRAALSGIMYADYAIKLAIGAPYCQYFIFNNLMAAAIIADYVCNHIDLKRVKSGVWVLLAIGAWLIWQLHPNDNYPRYYVIHDYIMKNMRVGEKIVNPVRYFFNIYGDNASYYWFGNGNVAPIASFLYGYEEPFDINKILKEEGPMFFYATANVNMIMYLNMDFLYGYQTNLERIWEKLGRRDITKEAFMDKWMLVYFDIPDIEFLEKYYVMTPYPPLMVRKDLARDYKIEIKQ